MPSEISVLHHLEVLALNDNCLYGSIPYGFGFLANLQELNLANNGLNDFLSYDFFDMSSITHLNLANQSENPRSCISSSGDRVELFNRSDGLECPFLQNISSLQYLKEISIQNNFFSGEISPDIKNLKQLGEKMP